MIALALLFAASVFADPHRARDFEAERLWMRKSVQISTLSLIPRYELGSTSLTLAWTAPLLTEGGHAPADCFECAVLLIPQKLGISWWESKTITDTLVKLPASDGRSMSYLLPLWVGYGSANVICRDAAMNWSLPSNYWESKNP